MKHLNLREFKNYSQRLEKAQIKGEGGASAFLSTSRRPAMRGGVMICLESEFGSWSHIRDERQ